MFPFWSVESCIIFDPQPRQARGACKIFYMGTRGSQTLPASRNEGFLLFFWHSDRIYVEVP
ncbi:MAG: protein of unknown function DUF5118 [CRESS associated satellite molecule]|uniref:Uncharacterized protein n=1 Tax=CRESS associated satellite molecule TaxID=2656732 RepID=A0A5Q2W4P5_9VIRU|nr:MAG: protein of unknown function DUF5118 [CRESS associated satellite molecule]